MSEVSLYDKNFAINEIVSKGEFYSVDNPPFEIYGVMRDENGYCRIPQEVADNTNDGVKYLNRHTSGGIIKFSTNSNSIAIKASQAKGDVMPHMAASGSNGFALYEEDCFMAGFFPNLPPSQISGEKNFACTSFKPTDDGFHDLTVYMPLYGAYGKISIKVDEGAEIRPPKKSFRNKKPVVFYGSSITQGGCASLPSHSFVNIISREMNLFCLNLGFSGSAKGEDAIVGYMADLDMSVFVLDYDHNAPTVEHLEATHEKVYNAVRKAHPDIPIIMASAVTCKGWGEALQNKRREVVRKTYENAVKSGDKNVYFLNGEEFYTDEISFNICTVDGCHPNDVGMLMMARGFEKVLKKIDIAE